jgi:Ran GTPase-activating protein (RanGAP) involved in mRNA processing and transport
MSSVNTEKSKVNPSCLEGLLSLKAAGLIVTDPEDDDAVCSAWPSDQVGFDETGKLVLLNLGSKRLRSGLPFDHTVSFSALQTLNLGGTDVPPQDTVRILTAVAGTIETLYLGGNMWNNAGAAHLGTWLATMTPKCLVHLDLRFNDIGPEGADALCQGLEANPTVVRLYLEGNVLGDTGASSVARFLRVPECPVQQLFLGANQIGPVGAKHLASVLATNKRLTKLYLEGNSIREEGADAFTKALTECEDTALKHLFCDNNDIGKEGSQRLAKALNSDTAIGDSL